MEWRGVEPSHQGCEPLPGRHEPALGGGGKLCESASRREPIRQRGARSGQRSTAERFLALVPQGCGQQGSLQQV